MRGAPARTRAERRRMTKKTEDVADVVALCERGAPMLEAMADEDAARLVERFFKSWIFGRIPPHALGVAGTIEADRLLGRLWSSLPPALTERTERVRNARNETDVRRWCWIPGLYLMSQDEDLLLMDDYNVRPLLDEAAAGCPKRDYALEIVEHHARDSVHHALWDGARDLVPRLQMIATWVPLARAAKQEQLTSYLERLASYAEPRRVDRDEARQRVLDVRRCSPDPENEPQIVREGREWVAVLHRANITRGSLLIDADRGVMRAKQRSRD